MKAMFKVGVQIIGFVGTIVACHLIDRAGNLDLAFIRSVGRRPNGSAVARRIVEVAIEGIEAERDVGNIA